jgi:predicted O-linked N-acetylglucosamine transferase (SPINDLY family)
MTNIKKITSKKNESKVGKSENVVNVTEYLKENTENVNDKQIKTIGEFLEEYKNIKVVYNRAQEILLTEKRTENELYVKCLKMTSRAIKFLDELNQFVIQRHKEEIKTVYYISSELLVRSVGLHMNRGGFTDIEKNTLYMAIAHIRKVLSLEPFHIRGMEIFKMVFLYLTIFNPDAEENLVYLNQILIVDPCDYQLHYNFGFMYHRVHKLDNSIYHYKMAIGIIDLILRDTKMDENIRVSMKQFKVKCLNGLGSIYFTVQDRDTALYYFNLAYEIDPLDPDVNNQIGVVYTELRITDKAIFHYTKGIENYQRAHISVDKDMLIASMYMNMGLAKCYECDFIGAIDGYNKALKYKPRLSLAYQNKLLDSNYISHLIEDPMYIARIHKSINKIYPLVVDDYRISLPNYKVKKDILDCKDKQDLIRSGKKINIGFVSGDFICHPVSYFIHSILNHINYDLFDVTCYSVKVVKLDGMFPKCKWHVVKNMTPEQLKNKIAGDNIDILFDLSAHTGDNRLDTFVLKPAPIQISYCGYPNSSGVKSMDYRITDKFCDSEKSQIYYQEKFIFMDKCFLAYSPSMGIDNIPDITEPPCIKNGYITFGTFNRFNKINEMVIGVWEKLLLAAPTARFVIKTKEFLTQKIYDQFMNTFKNKSVLDRVTILPYSDTYGDHLPDYNKMDIAVDTFPYSGTTTSCESLMMGVPILTLFDNVRHYHSQNVTTSLMKNCGLDEFVAYSQDEYIQKAAYFANNLDKFKNIKKVVRNAFINGPICDYSSFVNEFEDKLVETYKNHKW